nr:CBO0543 family protein [Neobacillus sp. Marseille-Q6967]
MILLIITVIACIIAVIFIPKRISYMEMYTSSFLGPLMAVMADVYLDLKFDLYGFFQKGIDYQYLLIFFIVYPAANIIFLNLFPFKKPVMQKILYILFFSGLTVLFEFLATFSEVFYHNGWKLWYSAVAYPLLFTLLLLNLLLIRKLNKAPED